MAEGTAHRPEGESFGTLLRRYRATAMLSQEALAERAGVSARAVSDLERGAKARPHLETVRLLAEALDLSPAERAALAAAARPGQERATGEPASPAADAPQPRLPIPPTPLVGRDQDVDRVATLLRSGSTRLVTLIGPGGVGKTRLALDVAATLAAEFPDGVAWVQLAPLADPGLVPSAVARALDLRQDAEPSLDAALRNLLQDKRMLLVLDNCEHLRGAVALLAADLLAASPTLVILATSRARLNIAAERLAPLTPLELPDLATPASPNDLGRVPSVELFVQRAQSVRPEFVLNSTNAVDVAEICRQLEGLPLALELAAARTRVLPPARLRALLEQRLPLLTGGGADLPARQRTLRDAIAWSHDLLLPAEQQLFRRIAVFAGGCTLEAAEAVCGDADGLSLQVLDGVQSLVDNSLISEEDGAAEELRYTMLATIREYALDRLAEQGEEVITRRRHAIYFVDLAERARPGLQGPEQGVWLDRLEADHENFRVALEWTMGRPEDADMALRLGAALRPYWQTRGYLTEGRTWLEQALAASDTTDSATRAEALYGLGRIAFDLGDYTRAPRLFEQSLELRRSLGDQRGVAESLTDLGFAVAALEDSARARVLHEEALTIWRELGDTPGVASSLYRLGDLALVEGDLARAEALYTESLAYRQQSDDAIPIAYLHCMLAIVARLKGDGNAAVEATERSLKLFRPLRDRMGMGNALIEQGHAYRLQRDDERAERSYVEALINVRDVGSRPGMVEGLEGLAAVAAGLGRAEHAAMLLGAATAWRARLDHPFVPASDGDAQAHLVAAVCREAEAAFTAGQDLTLDEAVDRALANLTFPSGANDLLTSEGRRLG